MFTNKNEINNQNDRIDISLGTNINSDINMGKKQGNIFNDNAISQIKKKEYDNNMIKEEENELSKIDKDSLEGDEDRNKNINNNKNKNSNEIMEQMEKEINISLNQMNDLENNVEQKEKNNDIKNNNNSSSSQNMNINSFKPTNIISQQLSSKSNNNNTGENIIQLPKTKKNINNNNKNIQINKLKNQQKKNNQIIPLNQMQMNNKYNQININNQSNQMNFAPNQNQIMPPFMNNQMMTNNIDYNNNFPFVYNNPQQNFDGFNQNYYPQPQQPIPFPYPYPYWNFQNIPSINNPNLPNPYFFNGNENLPYNPQSIPIMMPNNQVQQNKKINKNNINKGKTTKTFQNNSKMNSKNNNNSKNIKNNNKNKDKSNNKENTQNSNKNKKEDNEEDKKEDKKKDVKEDKKEKESETQKNITYDSSDLCIEESKTSNTKSLFINDSNTEKINDKDKKKEFPNKVGYLTQLKREKEKEIKKLEEKELKPKRPSKSKIVIISKDKKKNNYDNPSEIKMGRIYTTLNQQPKKIKSKTKSVQKGKINNNEYNEQIFVNLLSDNSNKPEYDIENLLQKKMQFDSQIKEIKEFLKK